MHVDCGLHHKLGYDWYRGNDRIASSKFPATSFGKLGRQWNQFVRVSAERPIREILGGFAEGGLGSLPVAELKYSHRSARSVM